MKTVNYLPIAFLALVFACSDTKKEENSSVNPIAGTKKKAHEQEKEKQTTTPAHYGLSSDSTVMTEGEAIDTLESVPETSEAGEISTEEDSLLQEVAGRKADADLFASVAPELEHRIQIKALPSMKTVGIKSYPNAYVVKLNTKTPYKGKMYITMELATSDEPEQVLGFYNTWKETWYYIEDSEVHTFKKDKDKYFRETNTLQILPFDKSLEPELDSLLSFNPQTLIRIYYEDMQ